MRRWIGTSAGVLLGAVLLVAAWAKALDPLAFAQQIEGEGLAWLPPGVMAILVLALEAGLGTALLLGVRRLWVLAPTSLLVTFFLFLTGRTYWRWSQGLFDEDSAACGCFGNLVARTPVEAFWQDLALLAVPLVLAYLGRGAAGPARWRVAAAGLAAAGMAVLGWMAPELPLDDLATRLKPGVEVRAICAGEGEARLCLDGLVPELARGEHLVVIADLEGDGVVDTLARLDAMGEGGSPSPWLLTDATREEVFSFRWERGPRFPVREAPAAMLRPLYRRLPRSFTVRDGVVEETFAGLPPPAPAGGQAASGS